MVHVVADAGSGSAPAIERFVPIFTAAGMTRLLPLQALPPAGIGARGIGPGAPASEDA